MNFARCGTRIYRRRNGGMVGMTSASGSTELAEVFVRRQRRVGQSEHWNRM